MDDEAIQLLMAMKKVNEALLEGLKLSVFVLEKVDELSSERRKTMIAQLKNLIEQGEKAFKNIPIVH